MGLAESRQRLNRDRPDKGNLTRTCRAWYYQAAAGNGNRFVTKGKLREEHRRGCRRCCRVPAGRWDPSAEYKAKMVLTARQAASIIRTCRVVEPGGALNLEN